MTDLRPAEGRERSQSELVGFAIVFALVLVAISAVSVFGVAALEEVRDATNTENGEYAMRTLDANIEALFYGSTTRGSTEVTLGRASVTSGQELDVRIQGATTTSGSVDVRRTLEPILYRSDQADIVYENTMAVRQQSSGSVAVTDPAFDLSDERAVVPVVVTTTAGGSVSGGTHRVVTQTTGTDRYIQTSPSGSVAVTISFDWDRPGRVAAWKRALEDELSDVSGSSCTTSGGDELTCQFETETLVVSVVRVEYGLR